MHLKTHNVKDLHSAFCFCSEQSGLMARQSLIIFCLEQRVKPIHHSAVGLASVGFGLFLHFCRLSFGVLRFFLLVDHSRDSLLLHFLLSCSLAFWPFGFLLVMLAKMLVRTLVAISLLAATPTICLGLVINDLLFSLMFRRRALDLRIFDLSILVVLLTELLGLLILIRLTFLSWILLPLLFLLLIATTTLCIAASTKASFIQVSVLSSLIRFIKIVLRLMMSNIIRISIEASTTALATSVFVWLVLVLSLALPLGSVKKCSAWVVVVRRAIIVDLMTNLLGVVGDGPMLSFSFPTFISLLGTSEDRRTWTLELDACFPLSLGLVDFLAGLLPLVLVLKIFLGSLVVILVLFWLLAVFVLYLVLRPELQLLSFFLAHPYLLTLHTFLFSVVVGSSLVAIFDQGGFVLHEENHWIALAHRKRFLLADAAYFLVASMSRSGVIDRERALQLGLGVSHFKAAEFQLHVHSLGSVFG
jgi:hypothetical protein